MACASMESSHFFAQEHLVPDGSIVQYKSKYFLYLGLNDSSKARLLNPDLTMYSGTPSVFKLKYIKALDSYLYNNHLYSVTKQGLISLTSGKVMSDRFSSDVKRLGNLITPF